MAVSILRVSLVSNKLFLNVDLKDIKKSRRAYRYLKDNISHEILEEGIYFHFDDLELAEVISRTKKLATFLKQDVELSKEIKELLKDYINEEQNFNNFSQKAKEIRNNNCKISDFDDFSKSVSKNLSNRSLYELQLLSAYHLAFSQNACNFSVPGAGKTSVVYGAFSYLSNLDNNNAKKVEKILIISPLSAFGPWELEFEECFGIKPTSTRLTGKMSISSKKDYLYSLNPSLITLMSYPSIPSLKEELKYFLDNNKTMVVLDEAHKIKNVEGGIISKSVIDIADKCLSRVVLTGTPAPNGYEDLYNLFKFIWPQNNVIPFKAYQLKDMSKRNDDSRIRTLLDSIEPYFIRVRKSDLGITPAIEHPPILVNMGESQRRIYDYIEKKYINDIIDSKDSNFRLDLVKARLVRMMQAAINPNLLKQPLSIFASHEGFDPETVSDDTKFISEIINYQDVEIPSKFVVAADLIRKIISKNQKVIVWATYINNIIDFQTYLKNIGIESKVLYGAIPVATGEVYEDDDLVETRESIIAEFHMENSDFNVIIANPFAVAESISLHKVCHNAIYLERSFNAAHFLQSKDRIHRYGLREDVETNYYYIISRDSIDEVIEERLNLKEKRLREIIESSQIPLFSNIEVETDTNDIKALINDYIRRTKKV